MSVPAVSYRPSGVYTPGHVAAGLAVAVLPVVLVAYALSFVLYALWRLVRWPIARAATLTRQSSARQR